MIVMDVCDIPSDLLEFFEPMEDGQKSDVFRVPTTPYPGAHFATFPPELIRPCVLAGTSAAGECSACGKAWVRVVERTVAGEAEAHKRPKHLQSSKSTLSNHGHGAEGWANYGSKYETTGWQPQCQCNAPTRPQTVADPFLGSGTTSLVAVQEGRAWVGCDLDERSAGWTRERLARAQIRLGVG